MTPDALLFLQVHRYRVTRVAIETKCDSFLATAEAHRIDFIRDDLQEDTVQQFEAVDPLRPRNFERNAKAIEVLGEVARASVPTRFKRIYGESGITYLDSEPIFKTNPRLEKFLTPATRIDFDAYMVRQGWLLMACSGQVYGINGQAILANTWHQGKVVTQHIMRIIPQEDQIRPGYLQAVLSHPALGRPLVLSRAYGTSVPELASDDIEQLPIPRLGTKIEDEIADKAEEASELRMKADEKENDAVARLEEELDKELEQPRGGARSSESSDGRP